MVLLAVTTDAKMTVGRTSPMCKEGAVAVAIQEEAEVVVMDGISLPHGST
jgi:hypothetical protein